MINFKPTKYENQLPHIQVIPLIDILLVNLSFFMAMFLYFNFESQLNISVPHAAASTQSQSSSQEIVINVLKEGDVVVGQKKMDLSELSALLRLSVSVLTSHSPAGKVAGGALSSAAGLAVSPPQADSDRRAAIIKKW